MTLVDINPFGSDNTVCHILLELDNKKMIAAKETAINFCTKRISLTNIRPEILTEPKAALLMLNLARTCFFAVCKMLANSQVRFQQIESQISASCHCFVISGHKTEKANSKILFGWKIVPEETYVMIEQFFLDLAEKHMLSDNLALVEKIEVRCGSSKVSVNQNVNLESEQDMEHLWELVLEVDDSLVPEDMFKKHIENKSRILEFISHCCRSRNYFFEIRKCQAAETGCVICKLPRSKSDAFSKLWSFPDPIPKANEDHYMLFYEIYGKDTTKNTDHLCFRKPMHLNYHQPSRLSVVLVLMVWVLVPGHNLQQMCTFWLNASSVIDHSTTFYEISDLAKANLSLFLNDDNCNIENDLIELQNVSNSMHEDDDNDIEDVEDYDETVDESPTEQ
ncbi:13843_t:CDS:2 [Cetraspora pellucida]|uniref:13843_t:CDS:1 n=1 Tax=Cetraspora pellucida TaxID=1433469 RepID=A0A9N9N8E1_9GLOM|nr:13843_t:CDS:2 [Cetraspora pellucida]